MHHSHSTTPRSRRPFARTARLALPLALVGTLALAGCAADTPATSGAAEQTLVFGLSGEPQDVRLGADQGGTGYIMDTLIHRGLLAYDATGAIVPGLAEAYEQVDPATYRFVLREGLTFSDGDPVTSENVRSTLLYLGDPANGARTVKGMSNIEDVEIVDDQELIVHLVSNDPDFFEYAADPTAFIAKDEALSPEATTIIVQARSWWQMKPTASR